MCFVVVVVIVVVVVVVVAFFTPRLDMSGFDTYFVLCVSSRL